MAKSVESPAVLDVTQSAQGGIRTPEPRTTERGLARKDSSASAARLNERAPVERGCALAERDIYFAGLRLAWVFSVLLLVGCGECQGPSGSVLELRASGLDCEVVQKAVADKADVFMARWGAVDLTGWTIRLVGPEEAPVVDGVRRISATNWSSRTITVGPDFLGWLPHEFRHVQLGPASVSHSGWCASFVPWELGAGLADDRAYLGCGT